MKKALASLALCALISPALAACNQSSVPCTVTGTQLSCSSGEVTITAPIPADIATVIGLVEPGGISALSVERATVPAVTCWVNTKTKVATCSNAATGKSASFPLSASSATSSE
jgi:hypothetical protein